MLLAAKEQLSELARGFGFAHAAGADQQKYTDRFGGIVKAGPIGPDAAGDGVERVVLSDDAFSQPLVQMQHGLMFVVQHAAHRNPGPAGNDASDAASVNSSGHQRALALQGVQFSFKPLEFGAIGSRIATVGAAVGA